MITITKNLSWKLILYFFLLVVSLFLVKGAYAQERPEDIAKTYGVTFPVADLGDCKDYASCRSFCEDPVNADTCVNFAKDKGFYKEDSLQTQKDKVLQAAKGGLGCDSYESCLNFCSVAANHDRCDSFAKNQGLSGGVIGNPEEKPILDRAKEVLGCSSANACRSFCEEEGNAGKCSNFAKEVGLRGGERRVGPGGCGSEGTCKSFCSDPSNFQVCRGFSEVAGTSFSGPGGCNSEESCKNFCQQNPQNCGFKQGEKPGGVEMCNRTPNCSWAGNNCKCGFYGETKESAQKSGEYAGFCSANPDKCKPGQAGGFENSEQRQQFEDFCKQNPDKCKPPSGSTTGGPSGGLYGGSYYGGRDPAAECGRYGCSWTGSSCQCSSSNVGSGGSYSGGTGQPGYTPQPGSNYTPQPGQPYQPYSGNYSGSGGSGSYTPPPSGSYTQPSSGSYTPPPSGSYTQPSSGSYTPPPSGDSGGSAPPPPSGDSGGGGSAPPPPSGDSGGGGGFTQGVSTERGLLQQLFDFLQGR